MSRDDREGEETETNETRKETKGKILQEKSGDAIEKG